MESFNDYVKNEENQKPSGNLFNMVNDFAKKFEGKDKNELLKAVFDEAKKIRKTARSPTRKSITLRQRFPRF